MTTVKLKQSTDLQGIVTRTLEVIKEGDYINVSHSLCNHAVQTYLTWAFVCSQTNDNSLVVTQIHYSQWPEYSAPTDIDAVLKLTDTVLKTAMSASDNPITVMCK